MRKKVVAITMDNETWEKAKEYAKSKNRTLSNFLSYLAIEEINRKENDYGKNRGTYAKDS